MNGICHPAGLQYSRLHTNACLSVQLCRNISTYFSIKQAAPGVLEKFFINDLPTALYRSSHRTSVTA